jgi:phosphorylated CTD-interacting factor 1
MESQLTPALSSDEELSDSPISPTFPPNGQKSSILLSPSPSSSSTSSVFSPGSSAAPPNGFSAPTDEELPLELVQQGWHKYFSKRENRFYYFNSTTSQSLWDLPQYDPLTDPLGIATDEPVPPPPTILPIAVPNSPASANGTTVAREKRSSEALADLSGHVSASASKRVPTGASPPHTSHLPLPSATLPMIAAPFPQGAPAPWDLETAPNVVILERGPFIRLHPTPELEQLRCSLAFRLRGQFVDLCHSRSHIEAPKEAFNRWLVERKVVDRGMDPLLPSNCFPEISRPLYHEIMNNIPIRLVRPKCTADARKQLTRYAEGAKKLIEANTSVGSEARKIVRWSAEEVFSWIRSGGSASCDEYERRLSHMRNQCQPHLVEAMRSNVERICAKLYRQSCEYANQLRNREVQYLTDKLHQQPIPGIGCVRLQTVPRRVFAFPAQLVYRSSGSPTASAPTTEPATVSTPSPPAIHCGLSEKDACVILRYQGESVRLRREFLHKLEMLYRCSGWTDKKLEHFAARVWCMVRRYQTYWGIGSLLPGGPPLPPLSSELSLPIRAFECLKRQFGVTFECFASPLNCYFKQYCSTFADTDGYFGSNGNFLHFSPLTGSMSAFPPFCEPLLDASFDHFDRLLGASQEALSFVVFLELNEYPSTSRAVQKLTKSRFKRKQLMLQPNAFEVRSGTQFMCDPLACNQRSSATLMIIFLQNDSGFIKYAPTQEKVDLLVEALKVPPELNEVTSTDLTGADPQINSSSAVVGLSFDSTVTNETVSLVNANE